MPSACGKAYRVEEFHGGAASQGDVPARVESRHTAECTDTLCFIYNEFMRKSKLHGNLH